MNLNEDEVEDAIHQYLNGEQDMQDDEINITK